MTKLFLVLSMLLIVRYGHAQKTFQVELPQVYPWEVDFDENDIGEIFVAHGVAGLSTGSRISLTKLNSDGETIFYRLYDHTPLPEFYPHVIATDDGGCILASESFSYTTGSSIKTILIWKIDEVGEIRWQKVIPTSGFVDLLATSDSSYLLLGREYFEEYYSTLTTLRKMDQDGNIIWQTNLGERYESSSDGNFDSRAELVSEIDGYYYVTASASTDEFDTSKGDFYKINLDGELIWAQVLPFDSHIFSIMKGSFKLGDRYYFLALNNTYEFDNWSGNYWKVNNPLDLNYNFHQGKDFDASCSPFYHVAREDTINYLRAYYTSFKELDYELELGHVSGPVLDYMVAHDGGHIILTGLDTTTLVTKTDCLGNDFWSNDCNSKIGSGNDVILFPNPATDYLDINTNFEFHYVEVFDLTGRLARMKNAGGCSSYRLQTESLASGTYWLIIASSTQRVIVPFVKI